ncbi:alkaline phosphatase D family protein [Actinomadura rubrisoli]|uniref:Alkaline phosphatase n=1 Tax=Actinomadura rubrisoli TaxID=2530368 RepID=A0A4V2YVQ1_9ACTN|nr:alkaline phosphatase D family protein [Actinomadura rubrisoli]TDD82297.1 alkaline phosphatase [Actinomadura rubrisoli]
MTRRTFLATTTIAGATHLAAAAPFAHGAPAGPSAPLERAAPLVPTARRAPGTPDPFQLGVASGDPAADGFVLWTRLAPHPLAGDGHGGMPDRDVPVEWQVAEDEGFRRVVRSGRATARRSGAHSVHVELHGLRPGADHFYRFRTGGHISPTGRTRTAPAPGALSPLAFGAVSCADYEHGYFTAYRRLAEQHPDLVLHLGDYLYEDAAGDDGTLPVVRRHTPGKCLSLADYRRRHAQYRTDPDLRAAHAAAPWAVIWDDHEVENNWAGNAAGTKVPGFPARRRAAIRAYYEHMPLRASAFRRDGRITLTRRLDWGATASVHLLDTRQFRSDQPCDDGLRAGCDDRLDSRRALLGPSQLRWLDAGLRGSRARWNILAQQVFLAQRDHRLGPGQEMALDGWDGYAAERGRLLGALRSSGARNPVVLTGDVHVAHACDLLADFDDPSSPPVGVELVSTSIASDGDGSADPVGNATVRAENPHIAFVDQRRGYVLGRLAPGELRAEFHTLPYVTRRGAAATVAATFTIPDGARSLGPSAR